MVELLSAKMNGVCVCKRELEREKETDLMVFNTDSICSEVSCVPVLSFHRYASVLMIIPTFRLNYFEYGFCHMQ